MTAGAEEQAMAPRTRAMGINVFKRPAPGTPDTKRGPMHVIRMTLRRKGIRLCKSVIHAMDLPSLRTASMRRPPPIRYEMTPSAREAIASELSSTPLGKSGRNVGLSKTPTRR